MSSLRRTLLAAAALSALFLFPRPGGAVAAMPAVFLNHFFVVIRYVAKIGRAADRETAMLRDVTRLTLALDDASRDQLRSHVLPVGWSASAPSGEAPVVFTGPEGVVLEVVKATEARRGIIEARFSVQGTPRPHAATLGQVRLEVEPTSARIRFAP